MVKSNAVQLNGVVPDRIPAVDRVNPEGSVPEVTLNVAASPDARRFCENAAPAVIVFSEAIVGAVPTAADGTFTAKFQTLTVPPVNARRIVPPAAAVTSAVTVESV
jgi:hypothetical protein